MGLKKDAFHSVLGKILWPSQHITNERCLSACELPLLTVCYKRAWECLPGSCRIFICTHRNDIWCFRGKCHVSYLKLVTLTVFNDATSVNFHPKACNMDWLMIELNFLNEKLRRIFTTNIHMQAPTCILYSSRNSYP